MDRLTSVTLHYHLQAGAPGSGSYPHMAKGGEESVPPWQMPPGDLIDITEPDRMPESVIAEKAPVTESRPERKKEAGIMPGKNSLPVSRESGKTAGISLDSCLNAGVEVTRELGAKNPALLFIDQPADISDSNNEPMRPWWLNQAGGPGTPGGSAGRTESIVKDALDTSKNPEIRKSFDAYLKEHQSDYPRLMRYEAVSEATGRYNCIAHSIRNDGEIILPKITVGEYDSFYAQHGFKPLDTMDFSLQNGAEKVVLYGLTPSDGERYKIVKDAQGEEGAQYNGPLCFHAIIQERDGTYTSKMGAHEQIKVQSPDDLGGGLYGNPVRVYVRKDLNCARGGC